MKPIIRWCGAKKWAVPLLCPAIKEYLSESGGRYIEPFMGGAAIALALAHPQMILADSCEPLVHTFLQCQEHPLQVAWMLNTYRRRGTDRESFYAIREEKPSSFIQRAAWFLYINACCYNGLWRVNSSGRPNMAFGRPKSNGEPPGKIRTSKDLSDFSHALRGARLLCQDFRETIALAREGDLVFVDSPYYGVYNLYTPEQFSREDHEDLAHELREAYDRGADIIAMNSDVEEVRELYSWAAIRPVSECRRVSQKATARENAECVIATTIPDHLDRVQGGRLSR